MVGISFFERVEGETIDPAVAQLQRKKLLKEGDRMIVLSDILAGGKFIETVQVRIV